MNTRELFEKDRDLRDKLAAVTQTDWFAVALAYVKSELFSRDGLNADHLKGARMFEEILVSIAAPDAPESEQLSSGLNHTIYDANKLSTDAKDSKGNETA